MLIVLFLLIMSACNSSTTIATLPDPVPDQNMSFSENGLSLILSETVFQESPKKIETRIQNNSQQTYSVGEFYHIEVKIEGLWYIITYSDKIFYENPEFKDFGSTLDAGEEKAQVFSVEALDIILTPGEYRLVKTFLGQEEQFHEVSIAVPFWVE